MIDENENRIYLLIPYELKEIAKKNFCKWDPVSKLWFCNNKNCSLIDKYEIYYLNVDYNERKTARELGAVYISSFKSWICLKEQDKLIELYN